MILEAIINQRVLDQIAIRIQIQKRALGLKMVLLILVVVMRMKVEVDKIHQIMKKPRIKNQMMNLDRNQKAKIKCKKSQSTH